METTRALGTNNEFYEFSGGYFDKTTFSIYGVPSYAGSGRGAVADGGDGHGCGVHGSIDYTFPGGGHGSFVFETPTAHDE